jgi:hypothetical protein
MKAFIGASASSGGYSAARSCSDIYRRGTAERLLRRQKQANEDQREEQGAEDDENHVDA